MTCAPPAPPGWPVPARTSLRSRPSSATRHPPPRCATCERPRAGWTNSPRPRLRAFQIRLRAQSPHPRYRRPGGSSHANPRSYISTNSPSGTLPAYRPARPHHACDLARPCPLRRTIAAPPRPHPASRSAAGTGQGGRRRQLKGLSEGRARMVTADLLMCRAHRAVKVLSHEAITRSGRPAH